MNVNAHAQAGPVGIERRLEDLNANAATFVSASQARSNKSTDLAKPLAAMAVDEVQLVALAVGQDIP